MDRRYYQTVVPDNPLFVRSSGRSTRGTNRGRGNYSRNRRGGGRGGRNYGNTDSTLWDEDDYSPPRKRRERSPVQKILRIRLDEPVNDNDLHSRPYNNPSVRNAGRYERSSSPPFNNKKGFNAQKDPFLPAGEGPNKNEQMFLNRINTVGARFRWYKLNKTLHGVPLVSIVIEIDYKNRTVKSHGPYVNESEAKETSYQQAIDKLNLIFGDHPDYPDFEKAEAYFSDHEHYQGGVHGDSSRPMQPFSNPFDSNAPRENRVNIFEQYDDTPDFSTEHRPNRSQPVERIPISNPIEENKERLRRKNGHNPQDRFHPRPQQILKNFRHNNIQHSYIQNEMFDDEGYADRFGNQEEDQDVYNNGNSFFAGRNEMNRQQFSEDEPPPSQWERFDKEENRSAQNPPFWNVQQREPEWIPPSQQESEKILRAPGPAAFHANNEIGSHPSSFGNNNNLPPFENVSRFGQAPTIERPNTNPFAFTSKRIGLQQANENPFTDNSHERMNPSTRFKPNIIVPQNDSNEVFKKPALLPNPPFKNHNVETASRDNRQNQKPSLLPTPNLDGNKPPQIPPGGSFYQDFANSSRPGGSIERPNHFESREKIDIVPQNNAQIDEPSQYRRMAWEVNPQNVEQAAQNENFQQQESAPPFGLQQNQNMGQVNRFNSNNEGFSQLPMQNQDVVPGPPPNRFNNNDQGPQFQIQNQTARPGPPPLNMFNQNQGPSPGFHQMEQNTEPFNQIDFSQPPPDFQRRGPNHRPAELVSRFHGNEGIQSNQPQQPPPEVQTEWERQLAELRADADAAYAALGEKRAAGNPLPGTVESRRPLLSEYDDDEEEIVDEIGLSQPVSEEDARRYGYETNANSKRSGRHSSMSSDRDSYAESNHCGINETQFGKMVAEYGLFFKCSKLPSQFKHGIEYFGYDVEYWRWSEPVCREKVWGAFVPDMEAARENAFSVALVKLQNDVDEYMKKLSESSKSKSKAKSSSRRDSSRSDEPEVVIESVVSHSRPKRYYHEDESDEFVRKEEELETERQLLRNPLCKAKEKDSTFTLEKRKESWSTWSKSSGRSERHKKPFGRGLGSRRRGAGGFLNENEWTWPDF